MSKIYIVVGETGEYSDRIDWNVAAYSDEEKAKKHIELAECRLREVMASENWEDTRMDCYGEAWGDLFGPLDPHFHYDYTGTRYFLAEVDVLESVPTTEGEPQ